MEDYFAAIKNVTLGSIDDIKLEFESECIKTILEQYKYEFHLVIGDAEDLLRMTAKDGKVVFVTWQIGTGDEMVMERTPEILQKFGLSNDPDADYG